MNIYNLINDDLFVKMIDEGFIKVQRHPTESLWIANYTQKTQFQREWNAATLNSRGVIYDHMSDLVARPFPKFFNVGEVDRPMLPGGPIRVQEKMDGSLGILYQEPKSGLFSIATRGSFTSDQALHATEVLRERYADFQPYVGFTYLFEIIFPENRIVLDYGDLDDLVLLDVVNNDTGLSAFDGLRHSWPGPAASVYHYQTLEEVITSGERSNAEGFVVYYEKTGDRVKVKHDEYVRLHKLLTNVSSRTIWELLSNGQGVEEILDNVPDEYYEWVRSEVKRLHTEFNRIAGTTWKTFLNATRSGPFFWGDDPRERRKYFAETIKDSAFKGILFSYYDDKPVDEAIWRLIKPEYSKPFWAKSEDVA